MKIVVNNDEMLGRTNDGVIAVKFYAMQKQIDNLHEENKQLEENWEQLKQWLEEEIRQSGSKYDRCYYEEFLDKIKELEGDKNE